MSDTVTVYHPTIALVSNDVPKGDAEKWYEQGWLKTGAEGLASEARAAAEAATAGSP
jgi:hypothetical protein